jgi:hypothetical protein
MRLAQELLQRVHAAKSGSLSGGELVNSGFPTDNAGLAALFGGPILAGVLVTTWPRHRALTVPVALLLAALCYWYNPLAGVTTGGIALAGLFVHK